MLTALTKALVIGVLGGTLLSGCGEVDESTQTAATPAKKSEASPGDYR